MKHTSAVRGGARRAPGSGPRRQAAVAPLCREAEHMRRLLAPSQGRNQASSAQHSSCTVDSTCSLMDRHGGCKGCSRSRRRRRERSEDEPVLTGGGIISRNRQQRRSRRGARLVTAASVLLASSTASAAVAAAAVAAAAATPASSSSSSHCGRCPLRRRETAFVPTGVDAPRRWATGGRPLSGGCGGGSGGGAIRQGADSAQSDTWGQCVSGRTSFQGDLRGGGGGGGGSGSGSGSGATGGFCRSPSRVLRMISAAGSQRAGAGGGGGGGRGGGAGQSAFSGEFQQPDDSWKRASQRQQQQQRQQQVQQQQQQQQQKQRSYGRAAANGASRPPSKSGARRVSDSQQVANAGGAAMVTREEYGVDGTRSGSGGVGGERSGAVGQEAVSWTPKTEGQGSWDRLKAGAGLWRVDLKRGVYTADVKVTQPLGLDLSECPGGVCVSKVRPGCSAELQGVRPGDRVVATSATLGDGLWEKNTVDGILSAVGTRLVFSETVTLRVERALEPKQLAAASLWLWCRGSGGIR